jgi:co-chaperonin GroES (HSP10)
MQGDKLASGARSAQFGVSSKPGSPIEFHEGMISSEPRDTSCDTPQQAPPLVESVPYRVINDMVLVRRIEAASDSAIVTPDIAQTLSNKGKVLAVSPQDPDIRVGDIVLFSPHAANDITLDGRDYLLLNRRQIYLIGLPDLRWTGTRWE